MWFPLSLDLLSHNQFFLTPVILILRFVPQLKWKPRPHLSVFVCKRISFSSSLAYRPHVSGENGHRKRIFFQKRSPRWRFLQTMASRLRVDGRKRRFSTTTMSYITFACSRLRDSRVCEHAKKPTNCSLSTWSLLYCVILKRFNFKAECGLACEYSSSYRSKLFRRFAKRPRTQLEMKRG